MTSVGDFKRLTETKIHQGYVWHLSTAEFESPEGEQFSRDIVRSPGAVGVLPLMFSPSGDAEVVLVRQFRPPYGRKIIEIPAGMRDIEGEDTGEVARRELIEEAGLSAGSIEYLTEIYPSPGMTDSITTLYLATDCTAVPHDRQGPEEAHLEVLRIPLVEAIGMVERAEICDAKTVVALLFADRRLD